MVESTRLLLEESADDDEDVEILDDSDDLEILDDSDDAEFLDEQKDCCDSKSEWDKVIVQCGSLGDGEGLPDVYAFDLDVSRAPPFSGSDLDLDGGAGAGAAKKPDDDVGIWRVAAKAVYDGVDRGPRMIRPIAVRRDRDAHRPRPIIVRVVFLSGAIVAETTFEGACTVYRVRRWLSESDTTGARLSQICLLFGDEEANDKSRLRDLTSPESPHRLLLQLIRKQYNVDSDKESFERFLNASDSSDAA